MDNQNAVPSPAAMSLAKYYAERLAGTPEQDREELQREIGEMADVVNTYYIFDDNSELRINRDGEYEVTWQTPTV